MIYNNKIFDFIKRNMIGIFFIVLGVSFVLGFELRSGAGSIFTGTPLGLTWIILGIIMVFITEKLSRGRK